MKDGIILDHPSANGSSPRKKKHYLCVIVNLLYIFDIKTYLGYSCHCSLNAHGAAHNKSWLSEHNFEHGTS